MPRSRRTFGKGHEPTVDEFCLLYLADRAHASETSSLVGRITQDGIATALGKPRANVSRSLKNLRGGGLVEERVVRVHGARRRKAAYFLTARGLREGHALRETMEGVTVQVGLPDGTLEDRALGSIASLVGRQVPIADLLLCTSNGHVDLTALEARLRGGGRVVFLGLEGVPAAKRFVGREDELRKMREFLQDPSARGVAITGMAGMGKTALAREFVKPLENVRSVYWRTITPQTTPLELVSNLVEFLALRTFRPLSGLMSSAGAGTAPLAGVLATELARIRPLIVFDDLHKASPELSELLGALLAACREARGTQILLVSRTRTRLYTREAVLRGPWVLEVPLEPLTPAVSGALLEGRIPPAQIPEAVQFSGGNPLILELVAERGMPPRAARREVERFIEEEVVHDLGPGERGVLELASVVEGGAPRALLLQAGSPEDLDSLVSRDILREAEPEIYSLHDVVRDATLARVSAARLRTLHRMAGEFVATRREPQAILQAIRHLVKADEHPRAIDLLLESSETLVHSGLAAPLAGIAESLASGADPATRSDLWAIEGNVAEFTGDWDRAIQNYRKAEGAGVSERAVAVARLGLGRVLRLRDRPEEAFALLEQSRDAFERIGDARLSSVLYTMGRLEINRSRFDEAEALLQESRAIAFSAGDRVREGLATYGLGVLADDRHDPVRGAALEEEALKLLERTGSIVDLAKVLTGYAGILQVLKRFDEALSIQLRANETARRSGDLYALSNGLANLAVILNRMERTQDALEPALESRRISDILGDSDSGVLMTTLIGRIRFKLGDRQAAYEEWQESERRIAPGRVAALRFTQLRYLGMMCFHSREFALARRHLQEARRVAEAAGLKDALALVAGDLERVDREGT